MELEFKKPKRLFRKHISLTAKDCQWTIAEDKLLLQHPDIDIKLTLTEISKIVFFINKPDAAIQEFMTVHNCEKAAPRITLEAKKHWRGLKSENEFAKTKLQILFDDIALWSLQNENEIEWEDFSIPKDIPFAAEMRNTFSISLMVFSAIGIIVGLALGRLESLLLIVTLFMGCGLYAAYNMMPDTTPKFNLNKLISKKRRPKTK